MQSDLRNRTPSSNDGKEGRLIRAMRALDEEERRVADFASGESREKEKEVLETIAERAERRTTISYVHLVVVGMSLVTLAEIAAMFTWIIGIYISVSEEFFAALVPTLSLFLLLINQIGTRWFVQDHASTKNKFAARRLCHLHIVTRCILTTVSVPLCVYISLSWTSLVIIEMVMASNLLFTMVYAVYLLSFEK
jgi:uncharacterized membrane protein YcjF (UPF0283 family)